MATRHISAAFALLRKTKSPRQVVGFSLLSHENHPKRGSIHLETDPDGSASRRQGFQTRRPGVPGEFGWGIPFRPSNARPFGSLRVPIVTGPKTFKMLCLCGHVVT